MSASSTTVTTDTRLMPVFALVGGALGAVIAVAAGPVVSWLLDLIDSAPGVLRLVDVIPLPVTLPLLVILGAVAGWLICRSWSEDVGSVTVDADQVQLTSKSSSTVFARAEIAEAFLDEDELVLLDPTSRELWRGTSDSGLASRLGEAFERFGYRWRGAQDPRDAEFVRWVDRSPAVDETSHALLRRRRRALDDAKSGEAETLREELADHGVIVRDRGQTQQVRTLEN